MAEKKKKSDNKLTIAAVAIVSAFVVFMVLLIVEDRFINQEITQPVVVAMTEVPRGLVLSEENMAKYFAVEQRAVTDLPADVTYGSEVMLVGKVTDRVIYKKEIVTTGCFKENGFYDGIIDPVEISIEVSELGQAVGGILRAGDLVNISSVVRIDKSKEEHGLLGNVDEIEQVPTIEAYEMLDFADDSVADTGWELVESVTGNFACQVLAEKVRVTRVFTAGGESPESAEKSGTLMVATVINVAVPRSLTDAIFLAMEEGTIRLSKVEEVVEETEESVAE